MNKLVEEMKNELVKSEMFYIYKLIINDEYQELFEFISTNSFRDFKDIQEEKL